VIDARRQEPQEMPEVKTPQAMKRLLSSGCGLEESRQAKLVY